MGAYIGKDEQDWDLQLMWASYRMCFLHDDMEGVRVFGKILKENHGVDIDYFDWDSYDYTQYHGSVTGGEYDGETQKRYEDHCLRYMNS